MQKEDDEFQILLLVTVSWLSPDKKVEERSLFKTVKTILKMVYELKLIFGTPEVNCPHLVTFLYLWHHDKEYPEIIDKDFQQHKVFPWQKYFVYDLRIEGINYPKIVSKALLDNKWPHYPLIIVILVNGHRFFPLTFWSDYFYIELFSVWVQNNHLTLLIDDIVNLQNSWLNFFRDFTLEGFIVA